MHLWTWRVRLKRWTAWSLALRKSWVKMIRSLTYQIQSKTALRTFRWGNLHFHIPLKSYLDHTKGTSLSHRLNFRDSDFKLHASFAVFRTRESLWQRLRVTWRSWVRIWRPQSSCAALCSRATRSTALTSSAREQRSSSCRPATQTWPTSWMRGENQTAVSLLSLHFAEAGIFDYINKNHQLFSIRLLQSQLFNFFSYWWILSEKTSYKTPQPRTRSSRAHANPWTPSWTTCRPTRLTAMTIWLRLLISRAPKRWGWTYSVTWRIVEGALSFFLWTTRASTPLSISLSVSDLSIHMLCSIEICKTLLLLNDDDINISWRLTSVKPFTTESGGRPEEEGRWHGQSGWSVSRPAGSTQCKTQID